MVTPDPKRDAVAHSNASTTLTIIDVSAKSRIGMRSKMRMRRNMLIKRKMIMDRKMMRVVCINSPAVSLMPPVFPTV